ncbi:MAG: hypothetical protein M3O31_09965 [Acidobacteriota bacterium]|nr:hypothetical protein [Acidobacteriota bacterium]
MDRRASLPYFGLQLLSWARWIGPTDGELDREAAGLIEHGGDKYWDTPSSELYNHIRTENDPERIIETLDETRDSLNLQYMNVRRQFKAVQQAIILNT